uniref:Uncharacterized protein n=1 Tax=Timema douglasi TaxID=61478 RepID=A0A7R8Z8T4_TIMDO|nr:unnamed protein product [Timema douglasi]
MVCDVIVCLTSLHYVSGSIRTSLLAGSTFNVTWHLAYPHRGGYRLQLLDNLQRPVLDLTPVTADSEFVSTDVTAQSYHIQLPPDFTCEDCTVRLMRQAKEWSDGYRFWSCADVDILSRDKFKENCSGHGRYLLAKCRCDRLYYGPRCQYRDECIDSKDCGDHGKCYDIGATSAPKKQCYCELGWFGQDCSKRSPMKSTELDFASYTKRELSSTFHLYWQVLHDLGEVEMVMVVNSTSYVGLGWRPRSLTATCKNFPDLQDLGTPQVGIMNIIFTDSDVSSAHPYTPIHDFHAMDCTDIIIGSARGTTSRIWDYYTRDRSTPRFDTFWGGKNDLTAAMGFEKDGVTTILFRRKLKVVASSKVTLSCCIGLLIMGRLGFKLRLGLLRVVFPKRFPTFILCKSTEPTDHSIERDLMHVIWAQGQEPNKYVHIPKSGLEQDFASVKDFYRQDELKYHGHKDQRGKTTLNFFEETTHMSATSAVDDPSICGGHWRTPQDCTPELGNCEYFAKWEHLYKNDELRFTVQTKNTETWTGIAFSNDTSMGGPRKSRPPPISSRRLTLNWRRSIPFHPYCDMKNEQVNCLSPASPLPMSLFHSKETTHMSATSAVDDPSICGGHWRTPQDCTPELGNCEYFAKWEHLYKNDELRFTVQTKNTETWTGIAFSNDTSMSQTDAILGWVDKNGRAFLMDTWIQGYTSPLLDSSQDIYSMAGRKKDGITTLSFLRKRLSSDPKDVSFTEKNCVYFMFPVEGGDFHPVNKKIRKHNRVPSISAERICIKPCRPEEMVVLSTTPAPPRLSYNVEVMLENLGESFQVPSPGSTEYEDLASTVSSGFGSVLKKLPGFYKLSVDQFKDTHGKVIAKMNLIVDKAQFEKGRSLETESVNPVEKALLDTVSTGRVGALTVNPEYLVFEPQELTSSIPVEESPDRGGVLLSTTKLYIVIGCIGALVLIAVIQAACTIYRTVRNPATHNKEPRANSTPVTPLHPTFTLVLGSLALVSLGGTDTCSDHLIPSSAWKDYSAANTNYAFEAFESEEKPKGPAGGSTNNPTSNGASRAQGVNPHKPLAAMAQHNGYQTPGGAYQDTRSLQRPRGAYQTPGQTERATYSLPRTSAHPGPAGHRNGYYTQDRNRGPPRPHSELQPDFYFMPSQRKYSGEVVRVYVDYNK